MGVAGMWIIQHRNANTRGQLAAVADLLGREFGVTFSVHQCNSLNGCVQQARTNRPDVVLFDADSERPLANYFVGLMKLLEDTVVIGISTSPEEVRTAGIWGTTTIEALPLDLTMFRGLLTDRLKIEKVKTS